MKKIKKILKQFALLFIILLTSIGLGINAAVLPTFNIRDAEKPKIEMVESKEDDVKSSINS